MSDVLVIEAASPAGRALAADPVLAPVVAALGDVQVRVEPDRFVALARAIVGQQLSTAAAATIWGRLRDAGLADPHRILEADDEKLRGVGLSGAKARYLRDLARTTVTGEVDLAALDALTDDDVIASVTRIKGVGRWTAEMFLVFSLGRDDVLALDDAGLLRSAGWWLGLGRAATGPELAAAGEAWCPHRTAASLYLWAALDRGLVPRTAQPGGLTPREG